MLKLTRTQFFKILILYTGLACAIVCCYNLKTLLTPGKKRAFRCSDESLAKPFVYDTVPPKQLYVMAIYFPMILIALVELISSWANRRSLRISAFLLRYALKVIVILTLFLIGLAVERLYKNVFKIKMGRLRPNFITVCNPITKDGYTCQGLHDTTIMNEYECNSSLYPSWAVSTAFASFPSGHTSLAAYSMIFLIRYLHMLYTKLHKKLHTISTLLILIVQTVCFFTILFVAVSRILDFRHHWSDVCAGFIGGSAIALILTHYLKSQLKNVEEWLTVAVGHAHTSTEEDVENCPALTVHKSCNVKQQQNYALELVSE